jgi:hypothetical protein
MAQGVALLIASSSLVDVEVDPGPVASTIASGWCFMVGDGRREVLNVPDIS